jgi:hypothetical protein
MVTSLGLSASILWVSERLVFYRAGLLALLPTFTALKAQILLGFAPPADGSCFKVPNTHLSPCFHLLHSTLSPKSARRAVSWEVDSMDLPTEPALQGAISQVFIRPWQDLMASFLLLHHQDRQIY